VLNRLQLGVYALSSAIPVLWLWGLYGLGLGSLAAPAFAAALSVQLGGMLWLQLRVAEESCHRSQITLEAGGSCMELLLMRQLPWIPLVLEWAFRPFGLWPALALAVGADLLVTFASPACPHPVMAMLWGYRFYRVTARGGKGREYVLVYRGIIPLPLSRSVTYVAMMWERRLMWLGG
jgi:hypothetical protein